MESGAVAERFVKAGTELLQRVGDAIDVDARLGVLRDHATLTIHSLFGRIEARYLHQARLGRAVGGASAVRTQRNVCLARQSLDGILASAQSGEKTDAKSRPGSQNLMKNPSMRRG